MDPWRDYQTTDPRPWIDSNGNRHSLRTKKFDTPDKYIRAGCRWAPRDRPPTGARAPHGDDDGAPAPPVRSDEDRPATGRTRTRRSEREWRDGILIINFTASQRRDGNILVMDEDGRVHDYDTGELVLVAGRKKRGD